MGKNNLRKVREAKKKELNDFSEQSFHIMERVAETMDDDEKNKFPDPQPALYFESLDCSIPYSTIKDCTEFINIAKIVTACLADNGDSNLHTSDRVDTVYSSKDPYSLCIDMLDQCNLDSVNLPSKNYNKTLFSVLENRARMEINLGICEISNNGFLHYISSFWGKKIANSIRVHFTSNYVDIPSVTPLYILTNQDYMDPALLFGSVQQYKIAIVNNIADCYFRAIKELLYGAPRGSLLKYKSPAFKNTGTVIAGYQNTQDKVLTTANILMETAKEDCEKIADMVEIIVMNSIHLYIDRSKTPKNGEPELKDYQCSPWTKPF